jgi:hypothetical protein
MLGLPTQNDKLDLEIIKGDLEKYIYQELNVAELTITTIAAKKKRVFVDPFVYKDENADSTLANRAP